MRVLCGYYLCGHVKLIPSACLRPGCDLFSFGISVKDLNTSTFAAPFAGYTIFKIKAVVSVPTAVRAGRGTGRGYTYIQGSWGPQRPGDSGSDCEGMTKRGRLGCANRACVCTQRESVCM